MWKPEFQDNKDPLESSDSLGSHPLEYEDEGNHLTYTPEEGSSNDPSRSMSTAHFSYGEDKMIREHEAKVQVFEALKNSVQNGIQRRLSFADAQNPIEEPSTFPNDVASGKGLHHTHFKLGSVLENDHNATEDLLSDELLTIYKRVAQCQKARKKYQSLSLQRFSDNPKNNPSESGWQIYPAPPKPTWTFKSDENKKEFDPQKEVWKKGADFDMAKCDIPSFDETVEFILDDADVYQAVDSKTKEPLVAVPTIRDYYMDMEKIITAASDGPAKSFAFKRLQYLEAKWNLYSLLNDYQETSVSKKNPHRDFYNVRKVDTHVHHSACMNEKHLLRFIKHKIRHCADEEVIFRDGKVLTLAQVFESLGLTAYDLSIDTLDMHAHKDTFHRFDKFNLKYNPVGESRLREIFLKTDNYINGRYLAEITREVFDDLEASKYQMTEYRISIYGRSVEEWDKLAEWVIDNKLFSHNVRWLIQIPRLYDVYKKQGIVQSFQQVVRNLFLPLFEVTQNPKSHPKLHILLQRVVGFDSVDDESKSDNRFYKKFPTARHWDSSTSPPYSYQLYYLYANMTSLNHWRAKRNFNTFVLRPHSGEAGDPEHLISSYLVAEGINHGILLRKLPFVQYLYYLDQVPVAMSPLSNNALFLTYDKNPFYSYFKKGLNVSLSTDDPLQFSYTREPLMEEYSVAAQIYKLSNVDLCELARNSVMQSGFEYELKRHWLGASFVNQGEHGNDIEKTNVPDIRAGYRHETLAMERLLIERYSHVE